MIVYVVRRLLVVIPMLLTISFLIYVGLDLTPGDPMSYMISPDLASHITPEQLQQMREALGLEGPLIQRYGVWLLNILRGDFGYSLGSGVSIAQVVGNRLSATLQLQGVALVFSTVLGCLLGSISALKRGTPTDSGLTVVGMLGVSVPEFFLGLVAIVLFALKLKWFPAGGRMMPGYDSFWDTIPHLVLPAGVLSLAMTAGVMRYARSSMLDSLGRDFIRTARSKGLPEWRINLLHAFRVALTPVVVLVGFRLPLLIGGSVIIEAVFQWPGVGTEFITAVRGHDYPMVMMIALLSVLAVLLASLLIDVLTAFIDPRVRLGAR